MTMDSLLNKHNKLRDELNNIIAEYKDTKIKYNISLNTIYFTKEEMKTTQNKYKKQLKTLITKYDKTKEKIYDVEDLISKIDEEILNDIVIPLPGIE